MGGAETPADALTALGCLLIASTSSSPVPSRAVAMLLLADRISVHPVDHGKGEQAGTELGQQFKGSHVKFSMGFRALLSTSSVPIAKLNDARSLIDFFYHI